MQVLKRNCEYEEFNKEKIIKAILAAMKNTGIIKNKIAEAIAEEIEERFLDEEEVDVSQIDTEIFNRLIAKKQKTTARAFEGYRKVREFQRENQNTIDEQMDQLITGTNEEINSENANKNAKELSTQRDYMAGIVSKDISRRFLLPPDIVNAHDDGIIHFHDMDFFAEKARINCCLVNAEDMLQNGSVLNKMLLEKPHRLQVAVAQLTQEILSISSSNYGGTTVTLTHLAPFVRDSHEWYLRKYRNRGLTEEQCKQFAEEDTRREVIDAAQTFFYQCNSFTSANGQSPFLSVFMYLGETDEYKEELAMLIEEFLKQRMTGVKNEKGVYISPAFPKLIYVLEPDNIMEGTKYWYLTELAAQCTAKRMVPDYISEKVMKELKVDENGNGHCYPPMGCRSFLTPYVNKDGKPQYYGRFNCGVVTINLVDVALSSEGDMDLFWEIFQERTEMCHKALQIRHKHIRGTSSDVAPSNWQYGALARLGKEETIDELLFDGYSTISLGLKTA